MSEPPSREQNISWPPNPAHGNPFTVFCNYKGKHNFVLADGIVSPLSFVGDEPCYHKFDPDGVSRAVVHFKREGNLLRGISLYSRRNDLLFTTFESKEADGEIEVVLALGERIVGFSSHAFMGKAA